MLHEQEYESLDERVVSNLVGVLAYAMQHVPDFAAAYAPHACATCFVGTCVRCQTLPLLYWVLVSPLSALLSLFAVCLLNVKVHM